LANEGSAVDTVSPLEVEVARDCGFSQTKILFTGTSIKDEDMRRVLDAGAGMNIDSISQLKRLKNICFELGLISYDVSMRWDPGIGGSGFNWKTITAGKESHGKPIKFGIPEYRILEAYELALKYKLNPIGLHFHVGSQWLSDEEIEGYLNVLDATLLKANEIFKIIGKNLEFINVGGGPGIRYKEDQRVFPLEKYFEESFKRIENSGLEVETIVFEPGRYIAGDAGLLLTRINTIKERYGDYIVGVDTGFNHLIRPAMYDAYHEIINCAKADATAEFVGTVAGNLCETGDILAIRRKMPEPQEGDVLAVHNAGAYGYSMSSLYNLREKPKEISILRQQITS
jgi:diaminopimelate decarboxylase